MSGDDKITKVGADVLAAATTGLQAVGAQSATQGITYASDDELRPFLNKYIADNNVQEGNAMGIELPDGTIAVGLMDGNRVLITTPQNCPKGANWKLAMKTVELMKTQGVSTHGKDDWCLPGIDCPNDKEPASNEAYMLFNARNAGKLVNRFANMPCWSVLWDYDSYCAFTQWFEDGKQLISNGSGALDVCPVRRLTL